MLRCALGRAFAFAGHKRKPSRCTTEPHNLSLSLSNPRTLCFWGGMGIVGIRSQLSFGDRRRARFGFGRAAGSNSNPIHVAEEACGCCSIHLYLDILRRRAVYKAADLEPLIHPWHYSHYTCHNFPTRNLVGHRL